MSLFTITGREHDLPPKWDGRDVTWRGWASPSPTTADFHTPVEARACTECGAIDHLETNRGDVAALPGETETVTITKMTRSGREYGKDVEQPATIDRALMALRCQHCNHDIVLDLTTNESWDLDSTDYTAAGSTAEQ